MSSEGGYSPLPPPQSQSGDGLCDAPEPRRHEEMLLEQKQHLLLQQHQQRLMHQRRVALIPESSSEKAGTEGRKKDGEASSKEEEAAALPVPPSVGRGTNLNVTNLDRLMESVTPLLQTRYLSEVNAKGQKAREVDSLPFFYLDDLWEFFSEWSYYGTGVPLLLNGKDPTEQYYVPFLSGMQLYVDPSNPSSRLGLIGGADNCDSGGGDKRAKSILGSNMQRLNNLSLGDKSVKSSEVVAHSHGPPSFQYLEFEPPFNRRPLVDKISMLVSQNPELRKYKSCDLLPSSWMCVAWYPIYRIPIGPTLKDLDASFLTFHSLSTKPRSSSPSQFQAPNTRIVYSIADPTAKISLPVFALAAYKLKGSIMSPIGPHECEQENSLLQAADKWLTGLEVMLPDFQFFRNNRR